MPGALATTVISVPLMADLIICVRAVPLVFVFITMELVGLLMLSAVPPSILTFPAGMPNAREFALIVVPPGIVTV